MWESAGYIILSKVDFLVGVCNAEIINPCEVVVKDARKKIGGSLSLLVKSLTASESGWGQNVALKIGQGLQ